MSKELVSVIIPTYNRCSSLCRCLQSVYVQEYKPFEVIVIDNGSDDGTAEIIKKEFSSVKFIMNKNNKGPAIARNQGIRASNGHYVWFIDSDVEIREVSCLRTIISIMEQCLPINIGALGGEYVDRARQFVIKKKLKLNLGTQSIQVRNPLIMESVDYLSTANFFCRKEAIVSVGGFNPYIPFRDDVWVSFLLKERGYKLMLDSRISIFHNLCIDGRNLDLFRHHRDRLFHYVLTAKPYKIFLLPLYEIISLFDMSGFRKMAATDPHIIRYMPCCIRDSVLFKRSAIARFLLAGIVYVGTLILAYCVAILRLPFIVKQRIEKNYNFLEV